MTIDDFLLVLLADVPKLVVRYFEHPTFLHHSIHGSTVRACRGFLAFLFNLLPQSLLDQVGQFGILQLWLIDSSQLIIQKDAGARLADGLQNGDDSFEISHMKHCKIGRTFSNGMQVMYKVCTSNLGAPSQHIQSGQRNHSNFCHKCHSCGLWSSHPEKKPKCVIHSRYNVLKWYDITILRSKTPYSTGVLDESML